MSIATFHETITFFGDKLQAKPEEEDLKAGEVELVIDSFPIVIRETAVGGGLKFEMTLGMIIPPLPQAKLKELVTNHFLGANTGGCTFALDESGTTLLLCFNTTPPTTPQEQWEALHRVLCVGRELTKKLSEWSEFIKIC